MKGTRQTYYPDSLNILNFRENNFRDKGAGYLSYGPSVGLGVKIPIKNYGLIFKADYKLGLFFKNSYYYYDDTYRNCYFRLMLGLKI